MKLATERTTHPDGRLMVVSMDLSRAIPATGVAGTLQEALDRWDDVSPHLQALYLKISEAPSTGASMFEPERMAAPLPRASQFRIGCGGQSDF